MEDILAMLRSRLEREGVVNMRHADARITIRIAHDTKAALQKEAERDGRSLSNWLIHRVEAMVRPGKPGQGTPVKA